MVLEAPGESGSKVWGQQGLGAIASEGLGKDLVQGSLLGSEMSSSPCVYARLVQIPSSYQDTPHSGSGSTLTTPLNTTASVETLCPKRSWGLGPAHSALAGTQLGPYTHH